MNIAVFYSRLRWANAYFMSPATTYSFYIYFILYPIQHVKFFIVTKEKETNRKQEENESYYRKMSTKSIFAEFVS